MPLLLRRQVLAVAKNSWRLWQIRPIFFFESFLSMIMTSSQWCRKCSSTISSSFKIISRAKVPCSESIGWCWWWTLKITMILPHVTEAPHQRHFRPTWWIGQIDRCCWTSILAVLNEGFLVFLCISIITQSLMSWMTLNLHWEIVMLSGDHPTPDMLNMALVWWWQCRVTGQSHNHRPVLAQASEFMIGQFTMSVTSPGWHVCMARWHSVSAWRVGTVHLHSIISHRQVGSLWEHHTQAGSGGAMWVCWMAPSSKVTWWRGVQSGCPVVGCHCKAMSCWTWHWCDHTDAEQLANHTITGLH